MIMKCEDMIGWRPNVITQTKRISMKRVSRVFHLIYLPPKGTTTITKADHIEFSSSA